jgi:hypothetical protein
MVADGGTVGVGRSNLGALVFSALAIFACSSVSHAADDWRSRPYMNIGGGSGFARVVSSQGKRTCPGQRTAPRERPARPLAP